MNVCLSLVIVITVFHWGCAGSRFPLAGEGLGAAEPSCPFCLSLRYSVSSLTPHLRAVTEGAEDKFVLRKAGARGAPWKERGEKSLPGFHAISSVANCSHSFAFPSDLPCVLCSSCGFH